MRRLRRGRFALVALAVLGACTTTSGIPATTTVTIFAASSLQDVFEDLEAAWRLSHPEVELRLAHDGSNVLAAQIGEGAPADVFVSADLDRPQDLVAAGHGVGAVVPFARNRVVLVASRTSDRVAAASDLADPGVRIVAAAPSVPITGYAEQLLDGLSAGMADPVAFREAVDANVVSREDNVRSVLAKVELGEGDAAIVYATDLATADGVREVSLPVGEEVTAEYGAVQISARPIAAEFMDWLTGEEATTVLAAAGFAPLRP